MTKLNTLVKNALNLGVKNEAAAKAIIRRHGIDSTRKLVEVITAKDRGPNVIVSDMKVSERSMPTLLAKQVLRKSPVKIRGARTGGVKLPGPRGYRFGPVWLKSIAEGKGIAVHPSNLPKLLATAASRKVNIARNMPQEEIARLVARHLS